MFCFCQQNRAKKFKTANVNFRFRWLNKRTFNDWCNEWWDCDWCKFTQPRKSTITAFITFESAIKIADLRQKMLFSSERNWGLNYVFFCEQILNGAEKGTVLKLMVLIMIPWLRKLPLTKAKSQPELYMVEYCNTLFIWDSENSYFLT